MRFDHVGGLVLLDNAALRDMSALAGHTRFTEFFALIGLPALQDFSLLSAFEEVTGQLIVEIDDPCSPLAHAAP